jgi:SPP1 gp7 family putative phage head morphogenesis protein
MLEHTLSMDSVTLRMLPKADRVSLKNSSNIAQALEDQWSRKISEHIKAMTPELLKSLVEKGKPHAFNLEALFIEHFFDVAIKSIRYAMTDLEEHTYIPPNAGKQKSSLAAPPSKIPDSLKGLMKLYDLYRKGKYKPKRAVAQAKEVKDLYLKKVKSVWEEHSEDFRKGDVATQEAVVKKIKDAAGTTEARAKNIVRTETTSYYNTARREFYDESQDITHYLFIAIRDAGTSPWCTPLTTKGKRGRSGLVYTKGDPLTDKETPACHPGCRSEFLPLSKHNPAHLRFIQDVKLHRRLHECFPLLKGWKAA